jgi:hypothetical protein
VVEVSRKGGLSFEKKQREAQKRERREAKASDRRTWKEKAEQREDAHARRTR